MILFISSLYHIPILFSFHFPCENFPVLFLFPSRVLIYSTPIACTFLGPSRKRGPPKGYIDAIEARLHQTEALLGIMIAASDDRAQTLLRDIAKVS